MRIVLSNSGAASKPFLERINLIQGDITTQDVDAIVIMISNRLEYSGKINGAVTAAAGHDLDEFILEHIYKPKAGEVYALPAFNLPAKHILVGITPHYRTEFDRRESDLSGVVRKVMELARCMLLTSIAFPPVMSGKHGFPKPKAARLICQGISDRMQDNFEEVRLVCDSPDVIEVFDRKLRVLGWDGYKPPAPQER